MNEGSDPPATLPPDLIPPSKRSDAPDVSVTQPGASTAPPAVAPAAPSGGVDYSALSDLSVSDPSVGGFSDFSAPLATVPSTPS